MGACPPGGPQLPTKRIFDLVILSTLALQLAWHGLVKPWGAHHAGTGGAMGLVGSAAVQAS